MSEAGLGDIKYTHVLGFARSHARLCAAICPCLQSSLWRDPKSTNQVPGSCAAEVHL